MDTHYQPMMPPLGAFYPNGHPPIMPPPPPELFQPRLHQLQTYSMESMSSFSDMDDPNRTMISPTQGSQRTRRRQAPGSEHVKHRRTRSGCYTCRQRRVKCDEGHPVCDRCRKGNRECTYPGSSATKQRKDSKSRGASIDEHSSPSGDEDDVDERTGLPVIADDEEDHLLEDSTPTSPTLDKANSPDDPAWSKDKNASPVMESTATTGRPSRPQALRTTSKHGSKPSISQNIRWASLPKDVKMYLRYQRDNLSHHHYAFKYDGGDFLKTTFLEIAMNDESQALLYAIVAFAAYYHAIAHENPRISSFLTYYNKSIMLLQQSLKTKKPSLTTLLTILQLATIEEFLGDWVNLLGHQRAAHQILTDLFTPQTIMQDETRRRIISWYIRFDLFAGIMSGGETTLDREWFAVGSEHYKRQAQDRPGDLAAKFEEFFSTLRLIATDVTLLFAAKKKEAISDENFAGRTRELLGKYANYGQTLETAFADPSNFVKSFSKPTTNEKDLTDYDDPTFLYSGELFTMNYILIDFWASDLMFKYQLTMAQGQPPSNDMTELAMKQCKMFEAVEHCDQGLPGALVGCQASLGIASLFLPKESKYTDWCRRKFALVEQSGYIYPPAFRQRMSDVWGVDVKHWWLPNDEGYCSTVRAVRDFIQYRAQMPKEIMDAHVRDMSGIFRTLKVEEQSNGESDFDQFTPDLETTMAYESSPDQRWAT